LAEISVFTELPRSTLLRLLGTLVELGFLRRISHGEYGVALKLWRIGCAAVDYENVRDAIIPTLRLLVEKTSETSLYAVYDNGTATYLEKVDGLHPIRAYASVGTHSPAYATATGKALLAWRDEVEIAKIGAAAVRLTGSTLVGADALLRHAAEIRGAGFALNRGEWRDGVWGIAAPVFGRNREPVAAIGVSGPRDRIEPQIQTFSAIVRAMARDLSASHGAVRFAPKEAVSPVSTQTEVASDLSRPPQTKPPLRPASRRRRRPRKSGARTRRTQTLSSVTEARSGMSIDVDARPLL
jgi:DNA-binding IclR family transcriptional regulator